IGVRRRPRRVRDGGSRLRADRDGSGGLARSRRGDRARHHRDAGGGRAGRGAPPPRFFGAVAGRQLENLGRNRRPGPRGGRGGGGLVFAFSNRSWGAGRGKRPEAFKRLRLYLPATTPTVFGRAVGRGDENVAVTTLQAADPAGADMATLVIVGSAETRLVP